MKVCGLNTKAMNKYASSVKTKSNAKSFNAPSVTSRSRVNVVSGREDGSRVKGLIGRGCNLIRSDRPKTKLAGMKIYRNLWLGPT